jgi:hypothetical protein
MTREKMLSYLKGKHYGTWIESESNHNLDVYVKTELAKAGCWNGPLPRLK